MPDPTCETPAMLELSRTVRFCVGHDGSMATDAPVANSFAAWPPMRGLGSYYELKVTCRGRADPRSGYFLNIKHIDQAVREGALREWHLEPPVPPPVE